MTSRTSSLPSWLRAATTAGAVAFLLTPIAAAADDASLEKLAEPEPGEAVDEAPPVAPTDATTMESAAPPPQPTGPVTARLESQRGRVEKIDLNKGEIEFLPIREGQMASAVQPSDRLTLKARPFDMERLTVGRIGTVKYRDYGGNELWLEPEQRDQRISQLKRSGWEQQKVAGAVGDMDVRHGTLQVGEATFQAHPEQLKKLAPGQFVSLSFSPVGDTRWVADIDARGQEPQEIAPEQKKSR